MSASDTLKRVGSELRERVAEAAQRLDVPGVAVGVALGGEEDYVYHGVTSIANPLPVDETTLFQIGSTTKTYTGTAIMVLVERGLIDLAAPVRRYLPDFRLRDEEVAANVTVLQLLNHTAGWAGDFAADTGYGDDALARYVARLVEANQEHPLGERVSYNNAALSVAGRVIEVTTGTTYEAAIRELVYEPLGLTEHFFFPWEIMTRRFAAGHARQDDVLQVTHWYEARAGHPPGTEHSASARDQIRYARFHLGDGGEVLRRATLEQMQTLTTPESSAASGAFAITWMLRDIDGTRIVAHGGSCRGHQSGFEMVPERDFAIVVLTNARHGLELVTELGKWAFDAYLGIAERVPDPLPLTAAELAEYTGAYEASTGVIEVTVDGDRLVGTLTVNPELAAAEQEASDSVPPIPFRILPDNQFLIIEGQYKGLRGGVLRDAAGRVSALDIGRVFTRRE
jgi:CubicO group peptidase (beta-lactamase class C family)